MLVTKTITKKSLETLVQQTFEHFGSFSCSHLLDSLKLLGFYYATNAGISITIEDLRTPELKKQIVETTNQENLITSEEWQKGILSDAERFETILDSWNVAAETLKNKIIEYYEMFDPANNLYIMAFSGARGNMSQVRQLVGMRGLMSDQEGKIIDLPIKTNFREGLSSIDYMVSSYGARKGIVDTALKTADSGYLTRRLVYVAQELVIRATDCQTKQGLLFNLKKTTNTNLLVGRYLIGTNEKESKENISFYDQEFLLTSSFLEKLKRKAPLTLTLRSCLTCQSSASICQKCYGWDLSQQKVIGLGEAVGIIAAQSIGEPGTQLTMRTFHTGGIFTGQIGKSLLAPFSGTLLLPKTFQKVWVRTSHGIPVLSIQQTLFLTLVEWKGKITEIELGAGSYLYISQSCPIKKDQLIADFSKQEDRKDRKVKPVYNSFSGLIRCPKLLVRDIRLPEREDRYIKVNQNDGVLWICASEVFSLPTVAKLKFSTELPENQPFAFLKLVTPFAGITFWNAKELYLIKETKEKICLCLTDLESPVPMQTTYSIQFVPMVQSYQYVDKHTVLGYVAFFALEAGKIYSIQQQIPKKEKYPRFRTFFAITEKHIWKMSHDESNLLLKQKKNKKAQKEKKNISDFEVVTAGELYSPSCSFPFSGIFLKKEGAKTLFQKARPLFVTRETIVSCGDGDPIFVNDLLASLVTYTQQTDDIVQGLPKIEQLIEAHTPKFSSFLFPRPGVILHQKVGLAETQTNITLQKKEFDLIDEVLQKRDFERMVLLIADLQKKELWISVQQDSAKQKNFNELNLRKKKTKKAKQKNKQEKKILDKQSIFRFPPKTEYEKWDELVNKQLFNKKIYQLYVAQSVFVSNWQKNTLFYDQQMFQLYRPINLNGIQKLIQNKKKNKRLTNKEWFDSWYWNAVIGEYGDYESHKLSLIERQIIDSLLEVLAGKEGLTFAAYQPGYKNKKKNWGVWDNYYFPRLVQKPKTNFSMDQFTFFNGVHSGTIDKELVNKRLSHHNPANKRVAQFAGKREFSTWKKITLTTKPILYMYPKQKDKLVPILRTLKTYMNRQGDYLILVDRMLMLEERQDPWYQTLETKNFLSETFFEDWKMCECRQRKLEQDYYDDFVDKPKDLLHNKIETSFFYLKKLNPVQMYTFPTRETILPQVTTFVDIGQPCTAGMVSMHDLLHVFFDYHTVLDGLEEGIRKSVVKAQLILLNSIQAIYQSQGVTISSKHLELIVRQLSSHGKVKKSGHTPLLPGELIRLNILKEITRVGLKWSSRRKNEQRESPIQTKWMAERKLRERHPQYLTYEPLFRSATETSVENDSFLSSAGFQETKRVLTKAALHGEVDWLRGLKECIILGRLLPAGSSFLNYNNHLDQLFFTTEDERKEEQELKAKEQRSPEQEPKIKPKKIKPKKVLS